MNTTEQNRAGCNSGSLSPLSIHTLIDQIHSQIAKAKARREQTRAKVLYSCTAKILRLWWTLHTIQSLRNQICDLQREQASLLSSHRTHEEYYKRNKGHILALETRITQLINKAL